MRSAGAFLELIKFEHTLFALPFAYLGMILATQGWPSCRSFIWITVAMAAARTLAMGFNRIADRWIDARNPRTSQRPLVSGKVSLQTAWTGTVLASIILIFAAWQLGPLPLRLLPVAGVFLFGYSFTKRFTWLSHYILGFTDGLAPVGAWIAIRGSLFSASDAPAWLLLAIVTVWIGGFDLIYACQDYDHDRQEGLFSVPARFGIPFALRLSVLSHLVTVLLLLALGLTIGAGWIYWAGMLVIAGLLTWEHILIRPDDMEHIDLAFFKINSWISVILFLSVLGATFFNF